MKLRDNIKSKKSWRLYFFSALLIVLLQALGGARTNIIILHVSYSTAYTVVVQQLEFSTFFSGTNYDESRSIAVAQDGSCYVTGYTFSSDFPTLNAYNSTYGNWGDAFIVKFNTDGMLLWSTYLGGDNWDEGRGIAVTSDGSCYVIGVTYSSNFPTLNAYNSTYSGNTDVFIAKFTSNGALLWSTFLGGNGIDNGGNIAISSDGSCYITGWTNSNNYPVLKAYNSTYGSRGDAFVSKFSSNGSLLWSTFLGGNGFDWGSGITITNDNNFCYVSGSTNSSNFPTANAYNSTYGGRYPDAFITKFHSNGTLLWSTYFGGNRDDFGDAITVGSDGGCYLTGATISSNFPTKNANDSSFDQHSCDAYVTRFANNGSLLWSTYLGGCDWEVGNSITTDFDDNCYVTGYTNSEDFPTLKAFNSTFGGYSPDPQSDAFIIKYASNGMPMWSTFLGGKSEDVGWDIVTNSNRDYYVTGWTGSENFPIKNAFDATFGHSGDTFITKFTEQTKSYITLKGLPIFFTSLLIVALIMRRRKK